MALKRRYWGIITPMPAPVLGEVARASEAMGLEGLWAVQLWGPPFVPLAAAAMATSRVKLGTGVALAFTRSPLETASMAMDLDVISGGRTVLGLGPTIRWWVEDWYGCHYGKPIPHLREAIGVIREIIRKGHTGTLGKIEGEYYKLDLSSFKTLGPPVRTEIPIYLPAVYETACAVAGQIGDGLAGHPIWCERWILDRVAPSLARGLAKHGRDRKGFDLNLWLFVAPGPNKRECIADARQTIAFYAQFSQYDRYFSESGFGSEARAIHEALAKNDMPAALEICSDEMVEHFALVGPVDEIRARVDRVAAVADSFSLMVPFYGLATEKIIDYNTRIAKAFYG